MKFLILNKDDKALVNATAKTGSIPVLQCLAIGKGEIVASDGHILARRKNVDADGDVVLINAEEISSAFRGQKDLAIDMDCMKGSTGNISVSFTKQEGEFPDIDKVMPKYEEATTVSIRTDILKSLLGVAGSSEYVTFQLPSNKVISGPIRYKASNGTWGAIMPYIGDAFKE